MFQGHSNHKSRILAVVLVLCMVLACVPTVFAETQSQDIFLNSAASSGGFVTLDADGGMLLVGTARIPKSETESIAVKYIYSDSLVLNEKSIDVICRELKSFGITISKEMMVSDSDVADKSDRRAIFACGSEETPTQLTAYAPAGTAEESFKRLFPRYKFITSEYTSLQSLFGDSDTVTLSDDGKTAYCSVVMDESYTEKIINGKPVTILMIDSEYKYAFRAPKMTFVKDEDYVTPSDVVSSADDNSSDTSDLTASTTSQTSAETGSLTAAATAPSIDSNTDSATASTTASASSTAASTTESTAASTSTTASTQTSLTASASAEITSSTQSTVATSSSTSAASSKTTATTSSTAQSTTTSTTASKTTASTTSGTSKYFKPSVEPTTTSTTSRSSTIYNRTTINSLSSQRGIVNTRRLPLNIRSGPGKKYMVVTVLPKGAYVTVLSTEDSEWYMVKTMGKVVGYAYSKYIKIM